MFCEQCGQQIGNEEKFCTNCGSPVLLKDSHQNDKEEMPVMTSLPKSSSFGLRQIITILVVLGFIGLGVYGSIDDDAVEKNNDALKNLELGNAEQGIQQLNDASQSAVTKENKINTLKNLGYAYDGEGKTEEALASFQQALALTTQNTFDYYLVSGEVALLESKPNSAAVSFKKAYELNPENFQINNSLALFYIDLENTAPQYVDYPKALTHALKARSINESETARQNLGLAYFFNDNYDQAISLFSQSNLDQHPIASLWLGLAYAGKEDKINAKLYIQKALHAGIEVPQEVLDYVNS